MGRGLNGVGSIFVKYENRFKDHILTESGSCEPFAIFGVGLVCNEACYRFVLHSTEYVAERLAD